MTPKSSLPIPTVRIHLCLLLSAAFLGLILGSVSDIFDNCGLFIEPLLMVLLFLVFLTVDFKSLKRSFYNSRFSGSAVILNFIWTPVFAYLLGILFFNNDLDIRIGLLLLLVTPCTDWYLTFTKVSGGDTALGSSILPVNLVLQIVLMPVYLFLFFGLSAEIDLFDLLKEAAIVILVPAVVLVIFKFLTDRIQICLKAGSWMETKNDDLQILILGFVVFFMFSSNSGYIIDNYLIILAIFIPLLVFFIANYLLSSNIGIRVALNYQETTALIFTTVARNSPRALAIASATFSDSPMILVILAVVPLIELPTLTVMSFRRSPKSAL